MPLNTNPLTQTVCVFHVGLEAQLLGIVVRKERPELEEQKDNLVINIAAGKKKLEDLEDQILRYCRVCSGSAHLDECHSCVF